jgi:hypothetical protein
VKDENGGFLVRGKLPDDWSDERKRAFVSGLGLPKEGIVSEPTKIVFGRNPRRHSDTDDFTAEDFKLVRDCISVTIGTASVDGEPWNEEQLDHARAVIGKLGRLLQLP